MDNSNKRNSFQGHGANINQTYPLNSSTMSQSSKDHSFQQESFNSDPTFTTDYTSNTQYLDPSFVDFNQSLNDSNNFQSSNISQDFLKPDQLQTQEFGYNQNGRSPHNLGLDTSTNTSFPNLEYSNQSLDPSLLDFNPTQSQQLSLDPTNLSYDNMNSMHGPAPTPPHLLRPQLSQSQSPSPRQTPSPQQQQMYVQPQRPRNMSESLDPSSAAFPHGYTPNDWAAGAAFRQHRRQPSDTFSEISSHSAQASPYMGTLDGFDPNATQHISPMANSQQDYPLFNDNLGFSQFNLNDQGMQPNHISPGHSPLISPSVSNSQQPLPEFNPHDFGMTQDLNAQFRNADGTDMFPTLGNENLNQGPSIGISGEADTMSPPEINIDFAPPSRQPSFRNGQQQGLGDALSPPEAILGGRKRAKSETFARSPSPHMPARGRSPSLQPTMNGGQLSVSPSNVQLPPSRSPSPASSRGRSASASGTREHMLDLANRDRSAFSGGSADRRQKHAATFQCHLCPKKFTRAYNLRSHLRTHTDERPFVCTVCGKAFARQHDRKRHEGLHSGEKKFVCKGTLKSNATWGCGRKFARADALGRHFRSEAGRVCIKPLLEEEAAERKKNWLEEQQQHQLQSSQGFVAPGPIVQMPQLDPVLPAALLQMYPEFANLNWGPIDSTTDQGMDDDIHGGRSSFDASSTGDWLSDNDMSDYQVQGGASQMGTTGGMTGWNSGEYLSDFEGR